jgi:hypothetical protein
LSVTFALTGMGEAYLDDVTIEPLLPGIPGQPPPGAPFTGFGVKDRDETAAADKPADKDGKQRK